MLTGGGSGEKLRISTILFGLRKELRGDDAIEGELNQTAEKPEKGDPGGDRIEHVLVQINQETRNQGEKNAVKRAFAQGGRTSETLKAEHKQEDHTRREQEGKPQLVSEIRTVEMLNRGVDLGEDNKMEERIPTQREDIENRASQDEAFA